MGMLCKKRGPLLPTFPSNEVGMSLVLLWQLCVCFSAKMHNTTFYNLFPQNNQQSNDFQVRKIGKLLLKIELKMHKHHLAKSSPFDDVILISHFS